MLRSPAKLACVALCSASLVASPALASGPPSLGLLALVEGEITPDSANAARFGVEQQGQQLVDSGALEQAAELYWSKGVELKDPVLIVYAAEAWRDLAASERSIEAAQQASERAALALDMLYFLRDGATSQAWQPIAPEYVGTILARAQAVQTDATELIAAIEAEQSAPAETGEVEESKKARGPLKPGTGLIAAGSAAAALGLGGVAMGVSGLVLGGRAQAEVEDPTVYAAEHEAAQARGRTANILAGVGLAVGGVGLAVGATLIVLGIKKRKRATGQAKPEAQAQVVPLFFGPEGGGLGVKGSF